jgi:hypothetical protein
VFEDLYQEPCYTAIRAKGNILGDSISACSAISNEMADIVGRISQDQPAIKVCGELLAASSHFWALLKSTSSCFFCLKRPPEHVLGCGHAKCDTCVRSYGVAVPPAEYRFKVSGCFLCLAKVELTARIKPPTAGPCVIGLDGGGIKGVIPLEFLKFVQHSVGPAYPLQEYFDCVIGTSSGTLSSDGQMEIVALLIAIRCYHRSGPILLTDKRG